MLEKKNQMSMQVLFVEVGEITPAKGGTIYYTSNGKLYALDAKR